MPVSPTDTGIPEPAPPPSKSHHRHGSRASQSSGKSDAKSHQEYLDSLVPPSKELMKQITRAQEQKEEENLMKKLSMDGPDMSEGRKRAAATLIQRNYRGHRERRMLRGMSLDPSARWVEAIKEAKYRHMIEPRARPSLDDAGSTWNENGPSTARQQWKKIGLITMRAGGDPDSESDSVDENLSPEEREAYRQRRAQEKIERQKAAKIMDLQYFLEMVDLKHRYGANLRVYHEEWKMANTTDNFFYWLDQGEGRLIDCQGCPREQLDREQVRYLSKEERFNYLVKIDEQGRLCWAKNGARIDTTEKFKDSIHGIVPENDPTPAFTPMAAEPTPQDSSGDTTSISSVDEHEAAKDTKQTNTTTLNHPPPVKKVKRVSAATIFDKLLRGSVKANTWIFVADTNFRLYVGMKQSGVFQHSSFLHGSRISAAGSIKIQSGRLSRLSPLSGHYRPPGTFPFLIYPAPS